MVRDILLRVVRDSGDFTRRYWNKYERRISSAALIGGFIIDWLTLTRIDRFFDNLVIITYLVIVGVGICIAHFYDTSLRRRIAPDGSRRSDIFRWLQLITPTVMQFAIGGLFSAFSIFYSRSAALAVSWPVVFLMFAMLIANEFLQRRYQRLTVQITVFYFTLFSYTIFLIPLLLGRIETWVFLISGAVSLGAITACVYTISRINPPRFRTSKRGILISIASVFLVMNMLYYLNFLPPIPLSLEHARVAHEVRRQDGRYHVRVEPRSWYAYLRGQETVRVTGQQPVYVFSSVFAPRGLETNIVHEWQYWNAEQRTWETTSSIAFPVLGGRDSGYRGFSKISNWRAGRWRVDIKTQSGLVIGRLPFTIDRSEQPPTQKTLVW